MHKFGKMLFFAGVSLIGLTGQAYSADAFMALTGQTSQPIGHYEFCQRMKALCTIHNKDLKPVHLTEKTWNYLQKINQGVNARVRPTTDLELYGKEEYWAYPKDAGDCEDYVLQKQLELSQKGFPLSTLLITVVRKPDGEGHAVLTVRTDRGDFVLDNLREDILLWKDSEYTYLKRQSAEFTGRWVGIEQRGDLVVSSVTPKN